MVVVLSTPSRVVRASRTTQGQDSRSAFGITRREVNRRGQGESRRRRQRPRPRVWAGVSVAVRAEKGEGQGSKLNSVDTVEPSEGMVLLQRQGWKLLDLRDSKAYDDEHLTKPPQCSKNLPLPESLADLPKVAERERLDKSVPWLVADEDGARAGEAAAVLVESGWEAAAVVGGYSGWREIWTTSGRRVPPKGRWVATGKEALKSGLNVGGAALSYEERLNVEDLSKKEFKEFE